jgi:hypothetical protein
MAKAYIDPNALCCVEEARQRMTPEDFSESFPNAGGCSNVDPNSTWPKWQYLRDLALGKKPKKGQSVSKADTYITRSGSSVIYSCKKHANYARQRGASMERYLQYMRPELNRGESGKVKGRFYNREQSSKEKATKNIDSLRKSKQEEYDYLKNLQSGGGTKVKEVKPMQNLQDIMAESLKRLSEVPGAVDIPGQEAKFIPMEAEAPTHDVVETTQTKEPVKFSPRGEDPGIQSAFSISLPNEGEEEKKPEAPDLGSLWGGVDLSGMTEEE